MNTTDRMPLFVSRRQYDGMLQMWPAFMQACWPRLKKRWSISGAHVEIPDNEDIALELREKIALIRVWID